LARRNLTPQQTDYLIGIRYELEKKEEGGDQKSLAQNEQVKGTTAEIIGYDFGISPATVRRNAQFAQAVDKMTHEEKAEVLAGKSGKTKQEIKGFPLTDFRCPSIWALY
jgi:hypothetical protein